MKHFSKLIVLFIFTLLMNGCSTIEGIGKDIKKGGQAIEKAARKQV